MRDSLEYARTVEEVIRKYRLAVLRFSKANYKNMGRTEYEKELYQFRCQILSVISDEYNVCEYKMRRIIGWNY